MAPRRHSALPVIQVSSVHSVPVLPSCKTIVAVWRGISFCLVMGTLCDGMAQSAWAQTGKVSEAELPTVIVTGEKQTAVGPVKGFVATQTGTSTKTSTPIIETPQSLSVVTRDEMDARSVQSVVDAASYTAGVGTPYPDPHGDWLYVRGYFSTQYLDGMRVPYAGGGAPVLCVPRPWGLERLEVLRGPSSVLYGQNAPGGLANAISKRPTTAPQNEVQLQLGSFSRVQGAFDFSGPLSEDGKFLYRLNGLVRDADAEVDHVRNDRRFIAPSFTWKPSSDTSLTLLTHYLNENLTPRNWLPATGSLLFNPNGKIPHNQYLGEPGFDKYDRNQSAVGYAFEHRFNDALTVRQNFRYAEVDVFSRSMSAGFNDVQPNLRTVSRIVSQAWRDSESTSLDTNLQANFVTGAFKHTVLTGIDYTKYTEDTRSQNALGTPIDVFSPVYGAPFSGAWVNAAPTLQKQERPGFYLQDQIALDRWRFTLGGRYERVNTSTRNPQT